MKKNLMATALSGALLLTGAAFAERSLEIYITDLSEDTMDWFEQDAFPRFQESNPDVSLEILTGGWGDFDAAVAGWITTGSGPDIIYLGSEYAAEFGPLLADLDPYLADWGSLSVFLPASLDVAKYEGSFRGLPLLMSPRPIFYRDDVAADPATVPPLTFSDTVDFVTDNSNVEDNALTKMGFMDIGGDLFDAQEFIGYIWSAGGELYHEDGSSAFDSDETAEALQFMYDRRRAILPTELTAGLPPIEGWPIASDVVASGIFPMWNMPPVDDPLWDDITMAPYPAGENGEPLLQVFTDWLSVPRYAEDPELAADFLKFISSRENAIALSEVAGYTPVRQDAWEDLREIPVWDTMLDMSVDYGRAFSDIRASAELRPLLVEQVTMYLSDQQSLEDTMLFLKEEYDAILQDGGHL